MIVKWFNVYCKKTNIKVDKIWIAFNSLGMPYTEPLSNLTMYYNDTYYLKECLTQPEKELEELNAEKN